MKRAVASTLALPRRAKSSWRSLVVFFSALCFVLLASAAATHHHDPAVEGASCVLCSVAAEALADVPPPPPAPIEQIASLAYVLVSERATVAPRTFTAVLPPSCGPPASV